MNVRKTSRSTICIISIMKIESTSVYHHFNGMNKFLMVGLKYECLKDNNSY